MREGREGLSVDARDADSDAERAILSDGRSETGGEGQG